MKNKLFLLISVIILSIAMISIGIYVCNHANSMILQGEVEVKTIDLASKITGRVQKINVKKGDRVKKGDVLIELDTPEINAKAQQADATGKSFFGFS